MTVTDEQPPLAGKVALVTGASSGIGRETAKLLAKRGARVMGVARRADRLASLKEEAGVEFIVGSIETREECREVIAEARRRLGPITILVNNAGWGGSNDSPIWEETWENWDRSLALNLGAPFALSQLVAYDIRAAGWGRIVMVSSTAGDTGAPSMSPYCAAKHGVIGLMRSLAQDLASAGATCNAVLPGWVRTEMAHRDAEKEAARRGMSPDEVWAERAANYPGGRVLTPDEVALVIGFLVSEESRGINGEAIRVSRGSVW
ncbi:MAG: SDR family NAD(P)-dependent oxidoreductase [Hyphomicrobiales bacterium]